MKKDAIKMIENAWAGGEPVFVIRAKDKFSLPTLKKYIDTCLDNKVSIEHIKDIQDIYDAFVYWQKNNDDKLKFPD